LNEGERKALFPVGLLEQVDSLLSFNSFFLPEGFKEPLSFLRSGSDKSTGHLLGRGGIKPKEIGSGVGLTGFEIAFRGGELFVIGWPEI